MRLHVSGEGHTVAGILNTFLQAHVDETTLAYVKVNDPMCDDEGIVLQAPSRETMLAAVDDAIRLTHRWEESLRVSQSPPGSRPPTGA